MSSALAIRKEQVAELATLPEGLRQEIARWTQIIRAVESLGKPVTAAMQRVAEQHGVAYKTLTRKYYTVRKTGDLLDLADRRRVAELQAASALRLPHDFLEHWRGLLEKYQRDTTGRAAHRDLIRAWRAGEPIPGYSSRPQPEPCTGIPAGWSYRNLLRYKPSPIQLKGARIGRSAASQLLPSVYSTRVGIQPGQIYIFDDQEYDIRCVFPGAPTRTWFRPVGFNVLDLSTGCDFFRGYKPVTSNADGAREKLRQLDFEWFVVGVLTSVGYLPSGTTFIVEHGTTKAGKDFLSRVAQATGDAITWQASGVHGEQLAGLFRGQPRGNPKYKAHRESWFNLLRNEMAALPAPTGLNRDHDKEESYGLEKYTRQLLDAAAVLPSEISERLRFPALPWQDFIFVANQIAERINQRTDHELEGWQAMGRVAMEWRLDQDQPWLPQSKFLALPDNRRALAESIIASDPTLCRYRKLSPAEVWATSAQSLTRVSGAMVPILLGPDASRQVTVSKTHELIIQDRDLHPEPMVFRSTLTNSRQLLAGQELRVYLNPYNPTELQVCDPAGRWLGTAERVQSHCKTDTDALAREYGRVRKLESSLLTPVARRGAEQTRERIANMRINAELLDDSSKPTSEERAIIRRARSVTGSLSDLTDALDEEQPADAMQADCIDITETMQDCNPEPLDPTEEPTDEPTLADLYS
jgi:hypothetical protein